MNAQLDLLAVDRQFFAALLDADTATLARLLVDDFILIDVMSGSENKRSFFLATIGAGQVKFEIIDPTDHLVRLYGSTAVITGRTRMCGSFGYAPFELNSRYTHVYAMLQGGWRLVAAQGTQVYKLPH